LPALKTCLWASQVPVLMWMENVFIALR
jgi:hypothetical protein